MIVVLSAGDYVNVMVCGHVILFFGVVVATGAWPFESPQNECRVEPLAEWMYTWIQTVLSYRSGEGETDATCLVALCDNSCIGKEAYCIASNCALRNATDYEMMATE